MELERLSDFTAKVDAIEVTNERSTINASAEMESYGRVRFSLTLESGGDRSGGMCHGSGRGAMADGTFFSGQFCGVWSRAGTTITARYIDHVSDGTVNLYVATFDARGDEMPFEQHRFA